MKILKYPLIVILVLVVAFFAIGLFVPSFEYESQVEINAPVEEAWEVFKDLDKMQLWMTGLKQVKVVEGTAGVVGAKLEFTIEQRGEKMLVYETLTSFEEYKLYGFELDSEVLTARTEISFNELESDSCEIISKTEVRAKGMLWKSIFVMIRNTIIDQADQQYLKLKNLIEEGA